MSRNQNRDYFVIRSKKLSQDKNPRYVIVNQQNQVVDDAQGYGYQSFSKAWRAFRFKLSSGLNKRRLKND